MCGCDAHAPARCPGDVIAARRGNVGRKKSRACVFVCCSRTLPTVVDRTVNAVLDAHTHTLTHIAVACRSHVAVGDRTLRSSIAQKVLHCGHRSHTAVIAADIAVTGRALACEPSHSRSHTAVIDRTLRSQLPILLS